MTAATLDSDRLRFDLPPELEATEPAEARGVTRDAVDPEAEAVIVGVDRHVTARLERLAHGRLPRPGRARHPDNRHRTMVPHP